MSVPETPAPSQDFSEAGGRGLGLIRWRVWKDPSGASGRLGCSRVEQDHWETFLVFQKERKTEPGVAEKAGRR